MNDARPAATMEFRTGNLFVQTGNYGGVPAVFVAPAATPGVPGTFNQAEEGNPHVLKPDEIVMTFPTTEQARAVADALCGKWPDVFKAAEFPGPDTMIEYPDGRTGMAMFHYGMPESTDAALVAAENGFDSKFRYLDPEESEAEFKLQAEIEAGGDVVSILRRWSPISPGEGWILAEKFDAEEGQVAMFVRKRQSAAA